MLVIAGAVIGAVWGARVAKARGGNRLDMAQYGAGYAIALALGGLILSIVFARLF